MIYQHFTVLTNAPNGNLCQTFLSKETRQSFRHVGISANLMRNPQTINKESRKLAKRVVPNNAQVCIVDKAKLFAKYRVDFPKDYTHLQRK
jgi:hypothetical protein